jgi:hypothetical protein
MDQDDTTGRRRLKVAGIAAAALLAVPGGMAISNAFAASDGSPSSPTTVPAQSDGYPQPYGDAASPQDRGGPRGGSGDRGDCPGMGHGPGQGNGNGSGTQGSNGSTGYTLQ